MSVVVMCLLLYQLLCVLDITVYSTLLLQASLREHPPVLMLVGNKSDSISERKVTSEEGRLLALVSSSPSLSFHHISLLFFLLFFSLTHVTPSFVWSASFFYLNLSSLYAFQYFFHSIFFSLLKGNVAVINMALRHNERINKVPFFFSPPQRRLSVGIRSVWRCAQKLT